MFGSDTDLFSRHALERCRARGIRKTMIAKVLDDHDRDMAVGGSCRALSLSDLALNGLRQDGMTARELEGLRRLVIVWSDRTARVVTAFRIDRGRRDRRYLRQI